MTELLKVAIAAGVLAGIFSLAGILLSDILSLRQQRIKDRTTARESTAQALIQAHDDAMQGLRDQLEDMIEDRNYWRDRCLSSQSGLLIPQRGRGS